MCTYGNRTFRVMDYLENTWQEPVSPRVFATLEDARAYRDAEFPGASVWVFIGADGYLVYEDEDGASWSNEPPDDNEPQFYYSGRIPRGDA